MLDNTEGANGMGSNSSKVILAERIKTARQERHWSQAKLAEMLNVSSSSTVGNWENGAASPDYDKLCFLAEIFDVTTDYLLGRTDLKEPGEPAVDNLSSGAERLIKQYECCDDIGQASIDNCIEFHYKRCTAEPGLGKRKSKETADIQRIFLVSGKDADYEAMCEKIPYLKALRKDAKKSYIEITKYLWDIGYGDEICLAYVLDTFGVGINKRVPSQKLYNEIEAFLKGEYAILPNVRKT